MKIKSILVLKDSNDRIYYLLFFGLVARVLFAFWLSKYYFGQLKFYDADTWSFLNSFLNLINYGIYTFDFNNIDAYLYRGPVYSIFLGVHYLVFGGEFAFKFVALSQCVMDTASWYLIYRILQQVGLPTLWACFGAAIYLLNPIFISYSAIAYAETLSTFISLSIFLMALKAQTRRDLLLLGGLCAIGVMTRQHLGLLLPVVCLYLIFKTNMQSFTSRLSIVLFLLGGFTLVISPWFVRNTLSLGIPTILMGKTSGYPEFQEDFIAVDRFYSLFLVDVTPTIRSIARYGVDDIPDDSIYGPFEKQVKNAVRLAAFCGPSFKQWRNDRGWPLPLNLEYQGNCKNDVIYIFNELRQKMIHYKGIAFYLDVPFRNLYKSFFKADLTKNIESSFKKLAVKFVFAYRSIFMVLGVAAIIFIWKNPLVLMMAFPIGFILYVSFVMRHVEIRYLAQAEAFLSIYAVIFLHSITTTYFSRLRLATD